MHDSLGNAFVVEVEYFFAKDEVFEQRRSALSKAQAVLVIRNPRAVVRGQVGRRLILVPRNALMRFAAAGRRTHLFRGLGCGLFA